MMKRPFLLLLALLLAACNLVLAVQTPAPVDQPATLPPEVVASPLPTLTSAPSETPGLAAEGQATAPASTPTELMLFSHTRWHSLWADVTVIQYAGDGSNTPVQQERFQIWVAQPLQARLLRGPLDGVPQWQWISDGSNYRESGGVEAPLPRFENLVFWPPAQPSDSISPHPFASLMNAPVLTDLIFSTSLGHRQ